MTKPPSYLPTWTHDLLCVVGVVLIGSMFVAWIDVGWTSQTGLGLAWESNRWLFLVPLTGALLVAAASCRSEHTRAAAVAAGLVVAGNVTFQFAKGLMFDGGISTWLILGGAGVILGGVTNTRREWRVAGGTAVLAGFFAPWDDQSTWSLLTGDFGTMFRMLWLIPVAGVVAIGSGVSSHPRSGLAALIAGISVFGAMGWTIVSVANMMLGWGAWAAFGASAVALVIGVLARGSAQRPVASE